MNRKDYRKMMQRKKMSKIYSKSLILGLLGLGVTVGGNTIVKAEQREWKANTSTTIKAGDTEYKIVWGDTLSLISKDSGITIETLIKLNNILDANLIFEGNVIYFGNGASVSVKDESGNVIAKTPLTPADKQGIKEAQNNNTNSTNSTSIGNVNTGNSSSNVSSNTTNSNSANSNSGNNTSNMPTNPTKPEKPNDEGNGSETEKPVITEFDKRVIYQTEDGENVSQYDTKVKVEGTVKDDSGKFDIEYGFIDTTEKLPEGYKLVNSERDSYVKVFNTTPNIVISVEKIEDEKPVITEFGKKVFYQTKEGESVHSYATKVKVEGTIKDESGKFDIEYGFIDTTKELPKGYKLVDEKESNVKVFNTTPNIVIYVEKIEDEKPVEPEKPYVPVHTTENVTVNVDEAGNVLNSTEGYEKVSESTDGGKVTTQANGDTHTVYTTTIVWKKVVVTPPTTGGVSGEQFGGVLTSQSETDSELPVNGYTFPTEDSAYQYGYANQSYIGSLPENPSGREGFLVSSIKMKDGSTRWVVEWLYIIYS